MGKPKGYAVYLDGRHCGFALFEWHYPVTFGRLNLVSDGFFIGGFADGEKICLGGQPRGRGGKNGV